MASDPIDLSVFNELQLTAGAHFVADRVAVFVEEAPRLRAELHAAVRAESPERFRRAAHALKAGAQTFGAMALGAQARTLELGSMPTSGEALHNIDQAITDAAAALLGLTAGQAPRA